MQAQFLIPMAVRLGFGVVFVTAITLILVPTEYRILEDLKAWFSGTEEAVRVSRQVKDAGEDRDFEFRISNFGFPESRLETVRVHRRCLAFSREARTYGNDPRSARYSALGTDPAPARMVECEPSLIQFECSQLRR